MIPIDGEFLLTISPRFSGQKARDQYTIISALSDYLTPVLQEYDIHSRLRIAHFFGQVAHECAGFRTTEEFASGRAYEGRQDLGNTEPGDGVRYKGRGLIQLTGRANYRDVGRRLQLPLEDQPHIAAEPVTSLKIACEYWKKRDINDSADEDDLIRVTRKVNGGLNGLEDRRNYLAKAKQALATRESIIVSAEQTATTPVLRRGSFGEAVIELQQILAKRGFPLSVDGDFGPATELAVIVFQRTHALHDDGIVGELTWKSLRAAQ